MKKKIGFVGIILLTITILTFYVIEEVDEKRLTKKEFENSGLELFYRQVELTTKQVDTYLEGKIERESLQTSVDYLLNAYYQHAVLTNNLKLRDTVHYQNLDWIWIQYLETVTNNDLTQEDLNQLQGLENELKGILDEVSAEEPILKRKYLIIGGD